MALHSLVRAARVNYTVEERYSTRGSCFYADYPNPNVRDLVKVYHWQACGRFNSCWKKRQTRKLDAHR